MSTSHRHHFLPEFYLKGFTNAQGVFAVYNVQKRSIKKNWYSPKSHFFVSDHNSMEINGILTDIPEQAFSIMDRRMSVIFQKLQGYTGVPKLTVDEMVGLWHFLSNLFWRSPGNDAVFEKNLDITDARTQISLLSAQTRREMAGFPDVTLSDKDVTRFMRPLAGSQSVQNSTGQNFKEWKILYSPNGEFICGDRPFIAQDENDLFKSSFVVPLTKHHLLIKCPHNHASIPAQVIYCIQLALIQQANEFCAGPDKALFEARIKDPSFYSIEFLKDIIFGFLLQNHD
jgi:hypothetical protein